MAKVTSGSFNTTAYTTDGKTRYLTFSWSRTSYSVDKNTSTIEYTLKGNGTYTGWINTRNIKLVVNGTTVYTATGPIKVYNGTVLKSGTITISHNDDGTKKFSASAEAGIYYGAVNCTGDGTWEITDIPQKSSVKATDGIIGSTSTITISRASSSFTHTLTWSCLGLSGTFYTKTKETTVKPTIPTSIYAKIPNDKKAEITVTCETFNGSTSLGTNTCKFTANANENACKPTLSYESILDTNEKSKAVTKDNTKFVKGVSNAQISGVSATGNNSAKIKLIEFKCDTQTKTVTDGTATINAVTSGTFSLVATDSRGYSTTIPYDATMYDYFKPSMVVNVQRVEQTGNIVKTEYSGIFCNNEIASGLKVDFRYIKEDGNYSDWLNLAQINADGSITTTRGDFTYNGNEFSGSATFEMEFDYRKEHHFEFRVIDCLDTIPYEKGLIRGVPIFDYGENDFNFNVPLYYQNNPMDFIVEQGTSGNWTYRKWYSGIAECWLYSQFTFPTTGGLVSGAGIENWYVTAIEVSLPFKFLPYPSSTGSCSWNFSDLVQTHCNEERVMVRRFCNYNAFNVPDTYVSIQVIGRWK